MPEGNPILELLLVLVLILIGGFFAASEIALITVKRHRLNQLVGEGSRAARVAQRLTEDPSRFLATIQIALTFLGFMASAVGAVALSGSLTDIIKVIPLQPIQDAARGISFVVATHDPVVMGAADRILHLRHGALEAETKETRVLSVIDAAGRIQLPPAALKLFPDHRAQIVLEDGEVRITPP